MLSDGACGMEQYRILMHLAVTGPLSGNVLHFRTQRHTNSPNDNLSSMVEVPIVFRESQASV